MSVAKVREDETSTRQRILDAALDLFSEHGFAATSMRMLARAIGIRESSIYNHFSGKEDLYQSVMSLWGPAEFVHRLESDEYKALADDPAAFFHLCGKNLVARWLNPREQKFMAMTAKEGNESQTHCKLYDALFHEEIELLARYLIEMQRRRLVRISDPRETARIFCAGLTFLRLEHLAWAGKPSDARTIERAVSSYIENYLRLMEVETGFE